MWGRKKKSEPTSADVPSGELVHKKVFGRVYQRGFTESDFALLRQYLQQRVSEQQAVVVYLDLHQTPTVFAPEVYLYRGANVVVRTPHISCDVYGTKPCVDAVVSELETQGFKPNKEYEQNTTPSFHPSLSPSLVTIANRS